jgi:hypothetical protein
VKWFTTLNCGWHLRDVGYRVFAIFQGLEHVLWNFVEPVQVSGIAFLLHCTSLPSTTNMTADCGHCVVKLGCFVPRNCRAWRDSSVWTARACSFSPSHLLRLPIH